MRKIGENIQLVEQINEGGTANVFIGVNTWTGYPVAVKELKSNFFKSDFVRKKFKEEANRYLYLNHPNIVRLQDFIDAGDSQYLVMEFIEGHNLYEYQNNVTGPMPIQMASLLMSEALKALGFAHKNGVLHLDVKPSNIMLSDSNEVKVLDFGISQDIDEGATDKLLGTPNYMSPEQIKPGSKIDHRSDIYSAGVSLYELITGTPPYADCDDRSELFWAIESRPIPYINGQGRINEIIQKATAKDKTKRYQDCDEFYIDLIELV